MTALPVDQHQDLVRSETPETGRVHMIGPVRDRLVRSVEGRDDIADYLVQLGVGRPCDLGRGDHVHGHRSFECRTLGPRTGDHDRVEEQPADLELEVDNLGGVGRKRDLLLGGAEPDILRADRVRPGRKPKRVAPVGVGQNSSRRSDHQHLCSLERFAGFRDRDATGDRAQLSRGRCSRKHCQSQCHKPGGAEPSSALHTSSLHGSLLSRTGVSLPTDRSTQRSVWVGPGARRATTPHSRATGRHRNTFMVGPHVEKSMVQRIESRRPSGGSPLDLGPIRDYTVICR